MEHLEKLALTKSKLDAVSPSFCLAKWLQVTLHLQNGFNHSCHHPLTHQAPLDAVRSDSSALHNTPFKKEMRRLMLAGSRPPECEFCWRVEDTADAQYSDRILKSSDYWARDRLEEIAAQSPDVNINPSYVEVSFGSECNFRCSYCQPQVSTSLWNSFEKHGPYVGRSSIEQVRLEGQAPLKTEDNPYIHAFWDWFPSLAKDLKIFRITGGEPLINPNTFRVLDYLEENPHQELQLCINSNLGVPDKPFQRMIEKVKSLLSQGKIRDFILYTSIDTHGPQAEYLRVGLNYDAWLERVRTYLRETNASLTFMASFNCLSVPSFKFLLRDVLQLNRDFVSARTGKNYKRALIDISHITQPEYFAARILNERWRRELQGLVAFMEENAAAKVGRFGFLPYEIHKMARVANWAERSSAADDTSRFRAMFAVFVRQFEEREGKNFLAVFPEMQDFLECCQNTK